MVRHKAFSCTTLVSFVAVDRFRLKLFFHEEDGDACLTRLFQ